MDNGKFVALLRGITLPEDTMNRYVPWEMEPVSKNNWSDSPLNRIQMGQHVQIMLFRFL